MPTFDDILSDPYFAKLDRELSKFNIFHATDMKNREIKHTKFLGYLLDPNESHQLGTKFLWQFLRKTAAIGIRHLDLLNLNLQYTRVNIEYDLDNRSLDLLLEIPKNNNNFLIIAIENKIRAGEGVGQLTDYSEGIHRRFNGENFKKIFAYLTIAEEDPSNVNWININYHNTVIPAIEELLSDSVETISSYMRFILQDYIEIINRDEDQQDQALEIYRSISQEIKNDIKNIKNPNPGTNEYKVQILYPRAFAYIMNFDDDPRSNALRVFRSHLHANRNNFFRESSDRTFLRFTNFNQDIQDFLTNGICSSPTKPWLVSRRNLAFEIELRPSDDNNQTRVSTRITLGPTNPEFNLRLAICNKIRNKFKANPLTRSGAEHTRVHNFTLNESVQNDQLENRIKKIIDTFNNDPSYKENLEVGVTEFILDNRDSLGEIGVPNEILKRFQR